MESTTLLSSTEVQKRCGLSYRRIDHFIRYGAVTIQHPGAGGSGTRRRFTEQEAQAMETLGRVLRKAKQHGLTVSLRTIQHIWDSTMSGKAWCITLTTDERVVTYEVRS